MGTRRVVCAVLWVHLSWMGPLCLAIVAGLGSAASMAAPSEVSLQRVPIVLDGEMAKDALLREELELRLPDHALVVPQSPAEIPTVFLWVGAVRAEEGMLELQVIVSDGRLYQRPLRLPGGGERARVVAGAVANLVDGIEREHIAPTRTEVEMPSLKLEEEALPAHREPSLEQKEVPDEAARRPEARPAATAIQPTDVFHLSARAGLAAGVGPPTALSGLVGAGAALGFSWVRGGGFLVGGSVRGLGWRGDGLSIGRVRLLARVGYVWTRESWSVAIAAGPCVEPLWLGGSVRPPGGDARRVAPLVGAALSTGPRWRAWSRPGGSSVWLGADIDVSASVEARRSPGVVFVQDAATLDGLVTAGGLELGLAAVAELRVPRTR